MFAQLGLLSCFKIDTGHSISTRRCVAFNSHLPVHHPIHARCEGFIVARAKTDIQHRRPVLISVDEGRLPDAACDIVAVHLLVP